MEFVKMEGAGNDFILFDGEKNKEFLNSQNIEIQIIQLCDRHFGIGSDGLMYSESSDIADIKMNYYNSDGSIGELCGNGIRCFAKFVYEKNLVRKEEFNIETLAGIKKVKLFFNKKNVDKVSVNIGKPVFEPQLIPIIPNKHYEKGVIIEELIDINNQKFNIYSVRVGVPHTVIFIENIEDINIEYFGKKIENHKLFPQKTNVNFVKINNKDKIDLYSWERGAGRTLSCGTGACASVSVGIKKKLLNKQVIVKTEGGELEVKINNKNEIFLTGEAKEVFSGIT